MKHLKTAATALTVICLAAVLATAPALAAGSKSKKEDKPGVADYNAGVKLMKKGDFAGAQAKFEAALAADPSFAEAHNNLAFSMRKQGDDNYSEAMKHYDLAIELKPDLAEAYMYRGVLHALMGHAEAALADHAKLLELDRKLADELKEAIASDVDPDNLEGMTRKW